LALGIICPLSERPRRRRRRGRDDGGVSSFSCPVSDECRRSIPYRVFWSSPKRRVLTVGFLLKNMLTFVFHYSFSNGITGALPRFVDPETGREDLRGRKALEDLREKWPNIILADVLKERDSAEGNRRKMGVESLLRGVIRKKNQPLNKEQITHKKENDGQPRVPDDLKNKLEIQDGDDDEVQVDVQLKEGEVEKKAPKREEASSNEEEKDEEKAVLKEERKEEARSEEDKTVHEKKLMKSDKQNDNEKEIKKELDKIDQIQNDEITPRKVLQLSNMVADPSNFSKCAPVATSELSVALIVHSTPSRLSNFVGHACPFWSGTIVIVVYLTSETEMEWTKIRKDMKDVGQCRQVIWIEYRDEAENDNAHYPVNTLRNMGLQSVPNSTTHIFSIDVDFVPSRGLEEAITNSVMMFSNVQEAIVVPAFEIIDDASKIEEEDDGEDNDDNSIPAALPDLIECVAKDKCTIFQQRDNPDGHSSTETEAWLRGKYYENSYDGKKNLKKYPRQIRCFDSPRYEPYVVLRWCPNSVTPLYDERFTGYGKNKIEYVTHLRYMKYSFVVLPAGEYIIHLPHGQSKAKVAWEGNVDGRHMDMDVLYHKVFLRELTQRYGKKPTVALCATGRTKR